MTIPPRPHETVVHLTQPDFTREMHTVCTIDETLPTQMLRKLIAGDQLAVSPSGSHVAMVQTNNFNREVVTHSGFDGLFLLPRISQGTDTGTRILSVGDDHLYIWGRAHGRPPGVWLLAAGLREYLYPMETLGGFFGTRQRIPVGESSLYPGESVLFMPWGLWPVRPGSKIEVAGERLYVLEPLNGRWVAYCASSEGADRFTHVEEEDPQRLLPLGSGAALVSRHERRSHVREIGVATSRRPFTVLVEGQVIEAWGSSCTHSNSLAMLLRLRVLNDEIVSRLSLNQRILYEGTFSMRRQDFIWSPSGSDCAARITRDRRAFRYGKHTGREDRV